MVEIKNKKIGILQPVFMPWAGYFEQIVSTDIFVFLDDVQYTKQDWRNRNQIKTVNGKLWLTVPVRRMALDTLIKEVKINYEKDWQSKHSKTISLNYKSAPFYCEVFPIVEEIYSIKHKYLADLTINLITAFCEYMGIDATFKRSSDLSVGNYNNKNERLINIAKKISSDKIYLGQSSKNYVKMEMYNNNNISINFQDYVHPVYNQLHGKFISHLSMLDVLMNMGKESKNIIKHV